MSYQDNSYITTQDLMFRGVLNDIKKSRISLQPIYEAFTNALEAIKIKGKEEQNFKGSIEIKINAVETTDQRSEFNSLTISDNGIGFNETEFKRFNTFKDFTKGFKNLGSGRIQYAHHFDMTIIRSVFKEGRKFYEREFTVSKDKKYLNKNAIVFHKHCKAIKSGSTGTSITFNALLENSQVYNELTDETLKKSLMERYIHYFCHNKSSLPSVKIEFYVQSKLTGKSSISKSEIPAIDKTDKFKLAYSHISHDGKSIEKTKKAEDFRIDAFKVEKAYLSGNHLNLVSKGEIVEESNVALQSLPERDHVKGYKYLFLVSSKYIDKRDTDLRGELSIPNRESFSKNTSLFTAEEILIEDIQEGVNSSITTMYPEIEEAKKDHDDQLEKLKEMFLLDATTAKEINISINDSESKILEKFYEAEAKKTASVDASIKESIDRLEELDPTTDWYAEELEKEIEMLVKAIPQQNKTSLTHYVARRKLVLELFDKIIKRNLHIQATSERNIDEKLLHNLIFQQSNSNPEESDLWLVNEDFIYFKGNSEDKLKDIKINNIPLLRETLNPDEEKFKKTLGEDRYTKRPDILLFPDEGKCIIIEFKNPDVNVSDHLNQITNYASLIRNFANSEFRFDTFYGYLIGEQIDPMDVRSHDGDFKEAYHFDYLFRPSKSIPSFFSKDKSDAILYTEVIKYSTLLERAKRRNEIFIKKLTKVAE